MRKSEKRNSSTMFTYAEYVKILADRKNMVAAYEIKDVTVANK